MTGSALTGQKVELGGLYNVRDLGGYPAADGRTVARGLLYRASSLHRLTDEEAWREFGAATVIDLRYNREIEAFPLPDFIEDTTHSPVLPDSWKSSEADRSQPAAEFLAWVYDRMLEQGADSISDIVQQLADPAAYPAVFFCMAGKDRTGVVAAVVLSLLGVSESDIVDDFALSGEEVVALVEFLRTREDFESHPMMNQSEDLLRVPRAAMEIFLAKVDADFGGLDAWVRTLDVPDETITALRATLLQ